MLCFLVVHDKSIASPSMTEREITDSVKTTCYCSGLPHGEMEACDRSYGLLQAHMLEADEANATFQRVFGARSQRKLVLGLNSCFLLTRFHQVLGDKTSVHGHEAPERTNQSCAARWIGSDNLRCSFHVGSFFPAV